MSQNLKKNRFGKLTKLVDLSIWKRNKIPLFPLPATHGEERSGERTGNRAFFCLFSDAGGGGGGSNYQRWQTHPFVYGSYTIPIIDVGLCMSPQMENAGAIVVKKNSFKEWWDGRVCKCPPTPTPSPPRPPLPHGRAEGRLELHLR